MWAGVEDCPRRFDPVHPGHLEVHQNDIRLEGGGERHRLVPRRRLADERHVGGRLQQRAQSVAEEGVIIGDEDVQRFHSVPLPASFSRGAVTGDAPTTRVPPVRGSLDCERPAEFGRPLAH